MALLCLLVCLPDGEERVEVQVVDDRRQTDAVFVVGGVKSCCFDALFPPGMAVAVSLCFQRKNGQEEKFNQYAQQEVKPRRKNGSASTKCDGQTVWLHYVFSRQKSANETTQPLTQP